MYLGHCLFEPCSHMHSFSASALFDSMTLKFSPCAGTVAVMLAGDGSPFPRSYDWRGLDDFNATAPDGGDLPGSFSAQSVEYQSGFDADADESAGPLECDTPHLTYISLPETQNTAWLLTNRCMINPKAVVLGSFSNVSDLFFVFCALHPLVFDWSLSRCHSVCHGHTVTLSPYHAVALSRCHAVGHSHTVTACIQSHCHTVTPFTLQHYCHTVGHGHCHAATLSYYHRHTVHTITLLSRSYCHATTLSRCLTATLPLCWPRSHCHAAILSNCSSYCSHNYTVVTVILSPFHAVSLSHCHSVGHGRTATLPYSRTVHTVRTVHTITLLSPSFLSQ
jgi:hypothetical protein